MNLEEMLAVLEPFLRLETEGGVATIRLTDNVLMLGQDLKYIEAFKGFLDHVSRLPERAVVWITTRRSFSPERCDALWQYLANLEGRHLNNLLYPEPLTSVGVLREENVFRSVFQWLRKVPKPVIATFRGEVALPLLGAGLACEHRIAASDTVFCNRCGELVIPPAIGLLYMLPAYVGMGRAAALLMRSGETTAREAVEWGLINQIVPDDHLEYCAIRAAEEAARRSSPNSIAAMKNLLAQHLPPLDTFFMAESREVERAFERHEWVRRGDESQTK